MIRTAASPTSLDASSTCGTVIVIVVEDCGRFVVDIAVCVIVLPLVKMPVMVEVPVSATTITEVVVFVMFGEVIIVAVEADVRVIVPVITDVALTSK